MSLVAFPQRVYSKRIAYNGVCFEPELLAEIEYRAKSLPLTVRAITPAVGYSRSLARGTSAGETLQIRSYACSACFNALAAASRITPATVPYAAVQADFATGVQASFKPCSSVQSKADPTVS